MRFLFILLFLFTEIFIRLFAQENQPTISSTLSVSEIKKKLTQKQKYKTYKAYFKKLSKSGFSLGKIFIKKPNKMKIVFYQKWVKNIKQTKDKDKDEQQLVEAKVYIDENQLYFYFLQDKVLFRNKLTNESIFKDKSFFLKNWVINYDVEFQDYDRKKKLFSVKNEIFYGVKDNNLYYHMKLVPKDITLNINKIDLWMDDNGQIIRSKSYNNRDKVVSDLYFFKSVYNKEISNKEMDFIFPNNVQIIDNFLDKN